MIALNAQDFGNFITHPLLKPPQLGAASSSVGGGGGGGGQRPTFLKENTYIDATLGTVIFYSQYAGRTWQCTLQRSNNNALVTVEPASRSPDSNSNISDCDSADDSLATELSMTLTDFFNNLVYELDGTFLSYRDMLVTDKGAAPSVMLALNILVRKFPSPGVDF